MVNISNYYVCWLNFSIYCVMLIEFILKVIVMWIVYWEMVNWSECEWLALKLIDLWIVVENDVNVVYVELKIKILRYVDD